MNNENKLKLGIIGGVGPAASAYFYNEITAHTKADCDQDHLDIVMLSHASLPDRTKAIVSGNEKPLIHMLQKDVKTLEQLGVAHIAIPCNTSHYFFKQIQEATKVPLIHMIKESVAYAVNNYNQVKKIGIMGTDGTIQMGLYHKECQQLGVIPVSPSAEKQKDVMHIIYNEIKSGKKGSQDLFNGVLEELRAQGCDVIILACTELSVYKQYHQVPEYCLDAMDVLIRQSIIYSQATYID